MSEAGHEFVRQNFTWDKVAGRILTVIQNQLASP